ncbi:MAG TPA: hypothetical protein VGP25_10810 [Gemmatimonadaceae bacterium]|jgi:hypothetical protein|nr:hypothetical protein [Gemmatimonadaceae bacterium]
MGSLLSPRVLVGAALAVAALSCGEVPTLPDGIAYISSVILPAPAVAVNDTLRDSLGRAAPVRVFAFDANGDTIKSVEPSFVITTVPGKSATVTSTGFVIGDSVRTVQIVGRVGERLQTPPVSFDVVQQPDSIKASGASKFLLGDVATGELFSISDALAVQVSTGATATRSGVKGIIVRYSVTNVFPQTASIPDTTLVLIDDSNRFIFPTGRSAVDTTDSQGNASRRIRAVPFGFDSVEINATANDLKGTPLRGTPIRFVVTTK